MEQPYPYNTQHITQSIVFLPKTSHSELLEHDVDHTIMAVFMYNATTTDSSIIRNKLVQQYGGRPIDYHFFNLSPKAYIIILPEFLSREQVLHDLIIWSMQNHIHLWTFDDDAWGPAPRSYKVYLEYRNYPRQLWHPYYFHLLVARI